MSETPIIRRPLPFYGSWALFSRAMMAFKEHGLPERITSRSLIPLLGDEGPRVSSGFAAMGWINNKDKATPPLQAIVSAFGESSWQATLADIVPKAYFFVPGNWADLTSEQLHDAFVSYFGREAEVMSSAETFFLTLAHQGGFSLTERLYRRAIRAINDAKNPKIARKGVVSDANGKPRNLNIALPSTPLGPIPKRGVSMPTKDRENDSTASTKDALSVDLILKLSTLLGEASLTDQERKSVALTISVLGRYVNAA